MFGVKAIDWVVIIVYLVGITAVGLWAVKKVKSSASFFIGDRKFGKWMMMFFMFGSGTHSDQAVGVAAKTFRSGASGIWYQWVWLFATPFYWIAAPVFRRMRAVTTGDYFEVRYSPGVSVLFALVGMLQLMVSIGMMLKGSSAMITSVSGGTINQELAIIAMTIMFVMYGIAGGMSAAIFTDVIQGLLTIALSFMILPFAMSAVGGMAGLREKIADPEMLRIVARGEISVFFVAVVALNSLIGWATQPHTMAVCAAGKSEIEGRVGVTVGMFLKRICTVAWMLTGLCAIALYMGHDVEDVDHVYGLMAHDLLPTIAPGLIGLFIASMLASVMSSCDAFMVASSGLFTKNIYRKFLVTDKPDAHYILVGRVVSVLIVVGGIVFAFSLESVVQMLEIFWKIPAMMGIAFWAGIFWRRATAAGAWASTLTGFVIWFLTTLSAVVWLTGHIPYAKQLRLVYVKEEKVTPAFHDCHLEDASGFVIKLRDGKDPVSDHIRSRVSQETQQLLAEYDGSVAVSNDLRGKLVEELNKLVEEGALGIDYESMSDKDKGDVFYEPSRFEHVALSEPTHQLLSREPKGKTLARLNRRLLEEVYSDEIVRSWLFCECDIKKPVVLAERLMNSAEPVCLYFRDRLSEESRGLFANARGVEAAVLKEAIASEFNRIAAGDNIYDKDLFSEVFTNEATVRLAQKDLSGEGLVLTNNYLLEEAFIWEIGKNRRIEIYMPWQMIIYLSAGFVSLVVVSRLTRRPPSEKLDRLYACLRTPIGQNEPEGEVFTLPEGVEPAERNVLIDHPDFEIPRPSMIGIVGFVGSWAAVGLLIGAVYWIMGI